MLLLLFLLLSLHTVAVVAAVEEEEEEEDAVDHNVGGGVVDVDGVVVFELMFVSMFCTTKIMLTVDGSGKHTALHRGC